MPTPSFPCDETPCPSAALLVTPQLSCVPRVLSGYAVPRYAGWWGHTPLLVEVAERSYHQPQCSINHNHTPLPLQASVQSLPSWNDFAQGHSIRKLWVRFIFLAIPKKKLPSATYSQGTLWGSFVVLVPISMVTAFLSRHSRGLSSRGKEGRTPVMADISVVLLGW